MNQHVLFEKIGSLGLITLNRPDALNALTLEMILAIQSQLVQWQEDLEIHAVIVQAAGEKAFCAGGDIRWLYEKGLEQSPQQMEFFWHEYRLNHFISEFSKPFIALMDGITMGGGVGLAMHGNYPIATERFSFAMPETSIGFFPDVGASHLLSACSGHVGTYLALTGDRLNAQQAYHCGLVHTTIPSSSISDLIETLIQSDLSQETDEKVQACLQQYENKNVLGETALPFEDIANIFSHENMVDIFNALHRSDKDWQQSVLKRLVKKSPTSLCVTLEQMNKAQNQSLADCLQMDFKLVGSFMESHDFYEGVRALIIDKDKRPNWEPDAIEHIKPEMVSGFFSSDQKLKL